VVGECDVRDAEGHSEFSSPTLVTCMELKDREHAVEQIDEQMVRLTRSLSDLNNGSLLEPLKAPNVHSMPRGAPREVDLDPIFKGGFPVMKSVSLVWTVADGPTSSWFVVGTERRSLDEAVDVLSSPRSPARQGGVAQGRREAPDADGSAAFFT